MAPEITREFTDGKMIVKRDGEVVREATAQDLQSQLDFVDQRIASIQERRAQVASWKEQAEASA